MSHRSGEPSLPVSRGSSAILGLSIRNSYFTQKTIHDILAWAINRFSNVFILMPDEPAVDTLLALGYDERDALSKARLACNNLENKCTRALVELGRSVEHAIVRWANIKESPHYLSSYRALSELYAAKRGMFYDDIRLATIKVVEANTCLSVETAVNIGSQFLLKELAFIISAAEILEVATATYIYHRPMPILQKCLANRYLVTPSPANRFHLFAVKQNGDYQNLSSMNSSAALQR